MTEWADLALTAGGWILNFAAMATVLNKDAAVPRTHSVPVFSTMIIFFAAYLSLDLLGAAGSVLVAALIWLFIVLKRTPNPTQTTQP